MWQDYHKWNKCRVKIGGYLGEKIDSCIENGIMKVDFSKYVDVFRTKPDGYGQFCGEFWGKWILSAISACEYQPENTKLRLMVDCAVKDILQYQEADGRLSASNIDFSSWDIWGRKYAIYGLIRYYELSGSIEALNGAKKSVDEIISIAGCGKTKLIEVGLRALVGIPAMSIFIVVVLVYKNTRENRYLEFLDYLLELMEEPSLFYEKGARILSGGEDINIDPIDIAIPKGYELTSIYEGLCELYKITGIEKYRNIAVNYGSKLIEKEIMVVGSGSSSELWCDGVLRQTELIEQPMETCVTVTYMKFCKELYELTGDSKWIDQLEVSTYNALLGAMTDEGHWWAYYSPLTGARMKSWIQLESVQTSCCVTNGPRGVMTIPFWAFVHRQDELFLNLYTEGEYQACVDDQDVTFQIDTDYPKSGNIKITVHQDKPRALKLNLRIPYWDKHPLIRLNDQVIPCVDAGYLLVNQILQEGDIISIEFDMRGRIIQNQQTSRYKAIMSGPIVLSLDNRLVKEDDENYWLLDGSLAEGFDAMLSGTYYKIGHVVKDLSEVRLNLKPVSREKDGIWIGYEVEFINKPTHFFRHKIVSLVMCDYSSAGNGYNEQNILRTWLPQPLFMGEAFPKNSYSIIKDRSV